MNQRRDRNGRYVRSIEECIRHNSASVIGDASKQGRGGDQGEKGKMRGECQGSRVQSLSSLTCFGQDKLCEGETRMIR